TRAFLFPDSEGMIHEAGFHSVSFFFAFTIRNASFFYCISPTHLSEEPKFAHRFVFIITHTYNLQNTIQIQSFYRR
ncbi:MAG: hypothetical protein IJ524_02955, partial [Bacteroidales bacterium]|nr:hypothetical protein [Bacteroidales bacterium]